jgi:hypothetical protein
MDALLAGMSLHCGEEETARLVCAIETIEERTLAELVALAARYDANIGDIDKRQRAELRAVIALAAVGDEESARELALVAFRRLKRSVDRIWG